MESSPLLNSFSGISDSLHSPVATRKPVYLQVRIRVILTLFLRALRVSTQCRSKKCPRQRRDKFGDERSRKFRSQMRTKRTQTVVTHQASSGRKQAEQALSSALYSRANVLRLTRTQRALYSYVMKTRFEENVALKTRFKQQNRPRCTYVSALSEPV